MPRKHKQSLDDWTADIADRISKKNPKPSASSLPYIEPELSRDEVKQRAMELLAILQKADPNDFPRELDDIITCAFAWSTSPQRTDFWLNLTTTLRDWKP